MEATRRTPEQTEWSLTPFVHAGAFLEKCLRQWLGVFHRLTGFRTHSLSHTPRRGFDRYRPLKRDDIFGDAPVRPQSEIPQELLSRLSNELARSFLRLANNWPRWNANNNGPVWNIGGHDRPGTNHGAVPYRNARKDDRIDSHEGTSPYRRSSHLLVP